MTALTPSRTVHGAGAATRKGAELRAVCPYTGQVCTCGSAICPDFPEVWVKSKINVIAHEEQS